VVDQLSFADFDLVPQTVPRPPGDVFFAIRPGGEAAARIAGIAGHMHSRMGLRGRILADRFHITLHCIGHFPKLPQRVVDAAAAAAATVSAAPFEVAFDRVVSFGRSGKRPLVLIGPDHVAALVAFRQTLDAAIRRVGGVPRMSPQFTPHLTLLYDDQVVPEQWVEKVGWTVHELVLLHSHFGQGKHVPLARWPLRG
jgi:2'-5' RNA ligase